VNNSAPSRGRGKLSALGVAAGTAVALALAACSAGGTARTTTASKQQPEKPPQLTITPATGSGAVQPGTAITVHSVHGRLHSVHIAGGSDQVRGQLSDNGTTWRSSQQLILSRHYTVTATAIGADGKKATATSSFTTAKPDGTFQASTILGFKQQYGVGMPIILNFSHAITRKAAVERAISITTSRPVVGAWYWDGDKTLYFRPRTYWPQHTQVTFDARLKGVEGASGIYGRDNLTQTFNIGASLIVSVSTRSHYMHVYYKRRLWHIWAVSTGRPGDDTPNGTYVTIDKGNPVDMVGPGYNIEVPWSVRFTWSGVYIHDAYWSVAEQGITNVSHGCVNTSPAHAEEYYKLAVPGDPVTVTGSPVAGTWDDGWTVWFLSWHKLVQGSPLDEAVKAGPSGSTFVSPSQVATAHASAPLDRPHAHNARAD
jgi:lipoprotein-anchoring transpeptidase ErfK/SrfK